MKRPGRLLLPALLLLPAVCLFHRPGLVFMARFLEIREPLEKCDCIVVLAGERGERVRGGIALYREGYAPLMLIHGACS